MYSVNLHLESWSNKQKWIQHKVMFGRSVHIFLVYAVSSSRGSRAARLHSNATVRYPSYRRYRSFSEHFASCGLLTSQTRGTPRGGGTPTTTDVTENLLRLSKSIKYAARSACGQRGRRRLQALSEFPNGLPECPTRDDRDRLTTNSERRLHKPF
jgi:hypothetical protein